MDNDTIDVAEESTTAAIDITIEDATAEPQELNARLERAEQAKRAANKEAHGLRTRLKTLEEAEAKRAEADLSELQLAQKLKADAEAVASEAKAEARRYRLEAIAAKLDVVDAEAVALFIAPDVADLDQAVKDLLKAKPYLVKAKNDALTVGKGQPSSDDRDTKARAQELIERSSFLSQRHR